MAMERNSRSDGPSEEGARYDHERFDRIEQEIRGLFDQLPGSWQDEVLKNLFARIGKDWREGFARNVIEEYIEQLFPIYMEDALDYLQEPYADLSGLEDADIGEIMVHLIDD